MPSRSCRGCARRSGERGAIRDAAHRPDPSSPAKAELDPASVEARAIPVPLAGYDDGVTGHVTTPADDHRPPRRAAGAAGRRSRRDRARRLCRDRDRARGRRRAGRRAEDRLESRGPHRRCLHRRAVAAGDRARRRGREGPAPCRGRPVGVAAHRAASPEPDDRRAPARLCHGQCRHRPFECRAGRRQRERVLLLPVDPDASAEALRSELAGAHRQAHRGHHQRQFRPAVPPRHGRHRARRRRAAGGDRLARPARSVRPQARSHRDRLCRRDRRRRLAGAGPGRRGDADRAGARPVLVGAGRARPPRWSARRSTICSDERRSTARCWRCRAGSAAPSWRSASTASCRPTR